MTKLAVIYHSATGTTRSLAQEIIHGASSVSNVVTMEIEISGKDIVDGRYVNDRVIQSLHSSQAMIFGSPTYMGCVSAQFKAFADATGDLWSQQLWANKIAAGFTIGSNLNGDQLNTLQYLQIFANQHGMLWSSLDIPGNLDDEGRNRLGAQSGLIAHSTEGTINPIDVTTARYFGQRVAKIACLLGNSPPRL